MTTTALEQNWLLPCGSAEDPERATRCRAVIPNRPGPHPWTLIVHGYTSHGDWGFFPELSRRLAAGGIASVRVSLSGSGLADDRRTLAFPERFAKNGYADELAELAAVARRARAASELDADRRATLGHSRGGAMSLVHAAEDGGYRASVGWAAMDSILRFSTERLAAWRRDGSIEVRHFAARTRARLDRCVLDRAEAERERLDPLRACTQLPGRALLMVGELDRSVPPDDGRRLAAAVPDGRGRCHVIAGADHVFGARDPLGAIPPPLEELFAVTTAFLAERSGPRS
jgi:pimeloyl-ACP methyl ester carboxylesterase